jgi:hypothetical protein
MNNNPTKLDRLSRAGIDVVGGPLHSPITPTTGAILRLRRCALDTGSIMCSACLLTLVSLRSIQRD